MIGAADSFYSTKGFNGRDVRTPRAVDLESDPYRRLSSDYAVRSYYSDNGYVVVRSLLPERLCIAARETFELEVKRFGGHLYRQPAGGRPQVHQFTDSGFMLNGILNPHDLPSRQFGSFRRALLELLSHDSIQRLLRSILGESGKLVQSEYFEGNPDTWPCHDTYSLDSEELGSMAGVWIALEDIQPGAGRFYVCPGSHRATLQKTGGDAGSAAQRELYRQWTASLIESTGFELRAPALRRGDALLWNARTLHGNLPTSQPEYSRSSVTGHYVRESHRIVQNQSRIRNFRYQYVNRMRVSHPRDQDLLKNRLVLGLETKFPRACEAVRSAASKLP